VKLLADESVDGPIVARLRQDGYEVLYVAEMQPGISDDAVLGLANQQQCLLVTADRDFGDLVFHQHRLMSGIVLIRLAGLPSHVKAEIVSGIMREREGEMLHAFSVITRRAVRIRRPRTSAS
jgi:predicted nuclease of predicted toxin-antitoxin system